MCVHFRLSRHLPRVGQYTTQAKVSQYSREHRWNFELVRAQCTSQLLSARSQLIFVQNTNVVELHSRILKDLEDPSKIQLTFYLSGIGTYVPPSIRSLGYWKQWTANKIDLAIAWNFKQQVQDSYRWLADHYQPGDVIFLFGIFLALFFIAYDSCFSRGAYQVRTLAGMINKMGLVYSGNQRLIPFAYELYRNQHKGKKAGALCSHFKKTFSREVRVHFVGAWDTVSSVGIFRGKPLPLTTSADHICHFRHALALDERRVRFLPEYVHSAPQATVSRHAWSKSSEIYSHMHEGADTNMRGTIKEVWFAGTHGDMFNITLDLAGVPLLWMENEATSAGLHLQPRTEVWKWEELKRDKPNESLKGLWWMLEKIRLTRSTYNEKDLHETIRYNFLALVYVRC
ncbi:hypothetical protein B0H13DRAFT_1642136 [Mycena leptocephala]|nr:hypothetical protein B0H13DRAFT_1642136 [Mycena leptocephala]